MTVVLPVHLSCNNLQDSTFDFDCDGAPVLNMSVGMNIKISVGDLVRTLMDFMEIAPSKNSSAKAPAIAKPQPEGSGNAPQSQREEATHLANASTLDWNKPIFEYNKDSSDDSNGPGYAKRNSWVSLPEKSKDLQVLANELELRNAEFTSLSLPARIPMTFESRKDLWEPLKDRGSTVSRDAGKAGSTVPQAAAVSSRANLAPPPAEAPPPAPQSTGPAANARLPPGLGNGNTPSAQAHPPAKKAPGPPPSKEAPPMKAPPQAKSGPPGSTPDPQDCKQQ
eukprot:TRINITY_DN106248_c0_g1_i1.p1 TRINITY_DN106248_c0_g1~~TRINITY_DN106248_c0_g1_i1.p1  ORF type:complete len:280 (-),score=66.46 TRINITY_DN106248_c0_g1_i1:176-1015(-)